jgi:membrane protein
MPSSPSAAPAAPQECRTAPGSPPLRSPAETPSAPAARLRWWAREVLDGFEDNDLLTYASAISFQILTAIVPFLLFVLALASVFDLSDVWQDHVAPQLRANFSPALFAAIKNAVVAVFTGRRLLWATLGGALALWQISGAVRAVMGALARIYCSSRERSFLKRYSISFVLSVEVGVCFVLVAVCLLFAPFFSLTHAGVPVKALGFVLRWALIIALLWAIVGLLVRHAPAARQTVPWVSLGAGIVIASWVVVSVVFYLYLTEIASYQSVFGSLASVIVSLAYLYISATVFLFGAQLDAIIRARATGIASGTDPG